MTQHRNQAVLRSPASFQWGSLQPTPTGSTDTAVVRFSDFTTVIITGTGISQTSGAVNGTIVTLAEPGLYEIDLTLGSTGAVAIAAGIGINMAAAPIVADPVVGTDGVIKALDTLGVALGNWPIELGTKILVSGAQAQAGSTVRALATNSAGAAPVGLVGTEGQLRIRKLFSTPF